MDTIYGGQPLYLEIAMPNGKVQIAVGATAGFYSLAFFPPICRKSNLAVLLGRTVGGLLGGRLPGLLEPASNPRLRKVRHSAGPGSGVGLLLDKPRQIESCCLDQAKQIAMSAEREPDPWKKALLVLVSWAAEFIGSFLVGVLLATHRIWYCIYLFPRICR